MQCFFILIIGATAFVFALILWMLWSVGETVAVTQDKQQDDELNAHLSFCRKTLERMK